jgi:transposase InsO family protein
MNARWDLVTPVFGLLRLRLEVRERFNQKPARARGRVEKRFPEPRVRRLNHEADHGVGAGGAASVAGGVGVPEEVLTDNGTQYITWRGKSAFSKECEKLGIKQIVASPHRPQTLGKIERFLGTLWRQCVESAIFADLGDARLQPG